MAPVSRVVIVVSWLASVMEPVRNSLSYPGTLYNVDVLFDVLQALVSDALSSPLSADAVAARQLDC